MILTHNTEINESEVSVEFEARFGEIIINKITDIETGDAIDPELPIWLFNELHEVAYESTCD